jgi:hypothetical protein
VHRCPANIFIGERAVKQREGPLVWDGFSNFDLNIFSIAPPPVTSYGEHKKLDIFSKIEKRPHMRESSEHWNSEAPEFVRSAKKLGVDFDSRRLSNGVQLRPSWVDGNQPHPPCQASGATGHGPFSRSPEVKGDGRPEVRRQRLPETGYKVEFNGMLRNVACPTIFQESLRSFGGFRIPPTVNSSWVFGLAKKSTAGILFTVAPRGGACRRAELNPCDSPQDSLHYDRLQDFCKVSAKRRFVVRPVVDGESPL